MKVESLLYIGTHSYSFRRGEAAEIIGVKMVTPARVRRGDSYVPRPCFELRFADGFVDYAPISESLTYTLEAKGDTE